MGIEAHFPVEDARSLIRMQWIKSAEERGLLFHVNSYLGSHRLISITNPGNVLAELNNNMERLIVTEMNDAIAHIYESEGQLSVSIDVLGKSQGHAKKLVSYITKNFTEKHEVENNKVSMSFWSMTAHGPRQWTRSIEVPRWEDIGGNYTSHVQHHINTLLNQINHQEGNGKLILWHGDPGGGKTYLIRALLREWREKVSASYIIDPETFFSAHADYMLDILMRETGDRPQLLIFEDTGEMLRADARTQVGQGLSRLLNIVDGLIGQGLSFMTLITTNERINRFHPALLRPGRCMSLLEVPKMDVVEANQWLQAQRIDHKVTEPHTLAELYAIMDHRTNYAEKDITPAGQYI